MLTIIWDLEIQTDHLISAGRTGLVIVNKTKKMNRTGPIVNFAIPADHRVKLKESEKRDKYLDHSSELKKKEHERDSATSCKWCSRYSHQKIGIGTGKLGNKEQAETIQTTVLFISTKHEEEFSKLVTQIPVKNNQVTLM